MRLPLSSAPQHAVQGLNIFSDYIFAIAIKYLLQRNSHAASLKSETLK
jgi:hypothetical protein